MILNEWIGQPWGNWHSSDDAVSASLRHFVVAWAAKKLPDIPRDRSLAEFNSLDSRNGKKALAWIKYIERQT